MSSALDPFKVTVEQFKTAMKVEAGEQAAFFDIGLERDAPPLVDDVAEAVEATSR